MVEHSQPLKKRIRWAGVVAVVASLVCFSGCDPEPDNLRSKPVSHDRAMNLPTKPQPKTAERLRIEALEKAAEPLRKELCLAVEQGEWNNGRESGEELVAYFANNGLKTESSVIEALVDIDLAVGENHSALAKLRQIPKLHGEYERSVQAKLWLALLNTGALEEASQYSQDTYLRGRNLLIGYEELPDESTVAGLRARAHIALYEIYMESFDVALATAHRRAASDVLPNHPELAWLAAEAINRWGVPAEAERYYKVALNGAYSVKAEQSLYMLKKFEEAAPELYRQRRAWNLRPKQPSDRP